MERITNTTIKSWKDKTASGRPVRKLVIESERDHADVKSWNVSRCLQIIKAAVMHYKDLCEGLYCGEYVEPVRVIEGVAFTYNPPPRKSVPYAAGIKVKASKVMDAYGKEVDGVPSKYKKEVVTDDPAWHRGGGAVEDILERKEATATATATATDAVYFSDSMPVTKKGRKKSRMRRGSRKGEDKQQGLGLGLEDDRSDGNGDGDGLLKDHHPEFGLFEVPCDEDYQPRERSASRRQRPRTTDHVSDGSAQPTTAGGSMGTSHAWTNAAWGPHSVHPLRQQQLQQQQQQQQLEAQEAQMNAVNQAHLRGAPWMAVHHYGHFSPMGRAPVPMPWTGVDTLSGVSQQSLMSGYGGYDGYGGLGGRQLIPSAWEDFSGYGYSSRMLRTNAYYTGMNRSRSSHNVFAGYEFCGDGPERAGQGLGASRHGTPRRDPSFDNMLAEFSEKCSVGGSRWMDTPTHDGQRPRGNGGNGGDGGSAADKDHDEERARRRLKF